jgi:hypothetical protein
VSSTNRSNARKEHVSDYYVTPVDAIVHFLKNIDDPDLLSKFNCTNGGYIFDPCAGGDKNRPMSYPTAIKEVFSVVDDIYTMDIRDDSRADIKTDYLTYDFNDIQRPTIIITNPPFKDAQAIIEKALSDVSDDGYVIMLLRLNFFGSKSRLDFWKKHMPLYTYVHSQRMSFTEEGTTDSIEYMHCIWKKFHYPQFTKLRVI